MIFFFTQQSMNFSETHMVRNACVLSVFVVLTVLAVVGCSPGQQPAKPGASEDQPPAAKPAPTGVAPAAAAVGERREAAPEKREPSAADANAQLTETVGLLSGLYLYQSYLNIGLLADGKAEKLYDDKAARSVLDSILNPLETVDKQLEKIGKQARSGADRDAVDHIRIMVDLLRRQGKELKLFWDSGRPEDGTRYEATRQEAWKQISSTLGFDKK
jgi:hypothetical protein